VLGLIQFARAIQVQTTLNYAVQMAARCYAVGSLDAIGNLPRWTCTTEAEAQAVAASISGGLTGCSSTSCFSVTANACGPSITGATPPRDGVLVTATLVFNFLGTGVTPIGAVGSGIPTSVTLGSSACFTKPS